MLSSQNYKAFASMMNQGGPGDCPARPCLSLCPPAGAFATMDFSFRSEGSSDEEPAAGKKGYEYYYNQELRKMKDELQHLEAGYHDREDPLLQPAPARMGPGELGERRLADTDRKVRDLIEKFERMELRDLRRLIRTENPRVGARVPRWDFRRVVCRALEMPYLIENEVLSSQLFDLLHLDVDGTASWLQVIAALAAMARLGRGETLRLLLELCDANRDNWLHYEELMALLKAVAEGRMVDEAALRHAMTDAGAVHMEEFYRWSGKEVVLEWIDKFTVQFETRLTRLRSGSVAGAVPRDPGVVAGTFESAHVAGASGEPVIDRALLQYMARLAHGVRRPEELERALRASNARVGQPVGEVEVKAVVLDLLESLSRNSQAAMAAGPDWSQFEAVTPAQLQRLIMAERGLMQGAALELQVSRFLAALSIQSADAMATRFVRVIQHDSGPQHGMRWADVVMLVLSLIRKQSVSGTEAAGVLMQLAADGHEQYAMHSVLEVTSSLTGRSRLVRAEAAWISA